MLCAGMLCGTQAQGQGTERLAGYVQAERFTQEKLNTMLFSTSVDPHWFRKGNCFWYEYKTGNGRAWYVVDPVAKTKRPLFDLDDIAAQITEIVKDPFTAQQLPIQKLEAGEDGRTFTFQITSSQDAKKDSTDKGKDRRKKSSFSLTTILHVSCPGSRTRRKRRTILPGHLFRPMARRSFMQKI